MLLLSTQSLLPWLYYSFSTADCSWDNLSVSFHKTCAPLHSSCFVRTEGMSLDFWSAMLERSSLLGAQFEYSLLFLSSFFFLPTLPTDSLLISVVTVSWACWAAACWNHDPWVRGLIHHCLVLLHTSVENPVPRKWQQELILFLEIITFFVSYRYSEGFPAGTISKSDQKCYCIGRHSLQLPRSIVKSFACAVQLIQRMKWSAMSWVHPMLGKLF